MSELRDHETVRSHLEAMVAIGRDWENWDAEHPLMDAAAKARTSVFLQRAEAALDCLDAEDSRGESEPCDC